MRAIPYLFLLLAMSAVGENPPAQTLSPVSRLKMQAEQFIRDKQPAEAAKTYEDLIALDSAYSNVLAAVLVDLYIQSGQAEKAISRAKTHMETTPDPQAYLASVYTKMKMYTEAVAILENELSNEDRLDRKLALLFQLTQIHRRSGNYEAAEKTSAVAVGLASGTVHEHAAGALAEQAKRVLKTNP